MFRIKVRQRQALFGTSLTMADGVFTAAVSVTSAVGGIGESMTMPFHDDAKFV